MLDIITPLNNENYTEDRSEIAEQAAVPNEKEGFTLRFQSNGALDYLIRQGDVQLLVQVGKQVLATY
jgi:hypothetical protein